jgi:hypothetical protein
MPNGGTLVTLVDCNTWIEALKRAIPRGFEFINESTAWNGGTAPLDLHGAKIVFVNARYGDRQASTLHAGDGDRTHALLSFEGLVVVFVSKLVDSFHLKNLLGLNVTIVDDHRPPTLLTIVRNSPLDPLFTKLGNRIEEAPSMAAATFETLVANDQRRSVALLRESARGRCALVPYFGNSTVPAIEIILREILPNLSPHLAYDEAQRWLRESDYLMPSLKELRAKRIAAKSEYELLDRSLSENYDREWRSVQIGWNELLTSGGDTLKLAVKRALELFGWSCVDVDDYWSTRDASRQKEEDLWIAEGSDPDPSKPGVTLIEVKSNERGTASERDYSQLIKYLSRRKSEFKNGDLQGLLAINHSLLTPPKDRPTAFTDMMIRDAKNDNVRLVTTWDIFQLVQRLLEGTTTKNEIRGLFNASGMVTAPPAVGS